MLGKVTTGYQITIPAFFRKLSNIKIGDHINIKEEGNKLIIEPINIRDANKALMKFNDIFKDEIKDANFNSLPEGEVMDVINDEIKQSKK